MGRFLIATTVCWLEAMTIRTQNSQIFQPIVGVIAIDVIQL